MTVCEKWQLQVGADGERFNWVMRSAKRIRDLSIETAIAVILVTIFVLYVFHLPKDATLPWGWIKLVVNTTIVFGFLVAWFQKFRRNYAFWIAITILLLFHLLVLGFFARPNQALPAGYYALLINPIELVIFTIILK